VRRATGIVGGLVFLLCCNVFTAFAQTAIPEREPGGQNGGGCAPGSPVVSKAVPWPSVRLGLSQAGRFSEGGSVTVAVVDTGVSAAASALSGAVAAGVDLTAPGRGRADGDCAGRGTFVAGIVAARPRDGSGFAGVAPAARILPVRVTPTEDLVAADVLAAGISAAVDRGASVVAVTASSVADSPALRTAVLDALRRNALVVAPATTQAARNRPAPAFPAHYEEVLAVTALGVNGASAATGESRVDLAAPGADGVVSLAPAGDGHVTSSGDEVAAAFVAGAAALLRSYRPELSAAAVRQRLLDTADRAVGPGFGAGVVDPDRALTEVLSPDGGGRPASPAERMPRLAEPPAAPVSPLWTVLPVAGGVAAVLAIAGTAAFVVRRRRPARAHPRTPSGSG
jgi:hypothetical protein